MNFKEKVVLKFDEINRYLAELEDILPETEKEYKLNLTERRACEKTIELAIEGVMSIMAMVVSHLNLGVPKDEDDIITILAKSKVLSVLLVAKIREMKGFRNIMVHKYGEIDDGKAYFSLQEELEDFAEFEKEVKKYLRQIAD